MSVFGVGGIITHFADINIAAPGANVNILTTSIRPKYGGTLRVSVILNVASVFNVTISDGASTVVGGLDRSVALPAGDLHTFTFGCSPDFTYNFQVETNGQINYLQVDEITMGVS